MRVRPIQQTDAHHGDALAIETWPFSVLRTSGDFFKPLAFLFWAFLGLFFSFSRDLEGKS